MPQSKGGDPEIVGKPMGVEGQGDSPDAVWSLEVSTFDIAVKRLKVRKVAI